MITGKNKERFEDWYVANDYEMIDFRSFYNTPFEMQQGVLLAYYDSLDIEVMVKSWISAGSKIYFYSVHNLHTPSTYKDATKKDSRNEAYQEAFKQADKLENEKL